MVEENINIFLFCCSIKELNFIPHAAEGISSWPIRYHPAKSQRSKTSMLQQKQTIRLVTW